MKRELSLRNSTLIVEKLGLHDRTQVVNKNYGFLLLWGRLLIFEARDGFRPVHRVDQGGSLICGGGGAPSARCRPRRVWGYAPPEVFINLIEYGVSFCILKYQSLSLYL